MSRSESTRTVKECSKEIYEELKLGEEGLTFAGLYYHLSALKRAGITEAASYREAKGGAPEKVWKLKIREIVIDLLENNKDEKNGTHKSARPL